MSITRIKHRNGKVLFEKETISLKLAVEAAVQSWADLSEASGRIKENTEEQS